MTCQLYRHYDKDGILLYVGISISALQRLKQHSKTSWFKQIERVMIEQCRNREYAQFLEALAIQNENPKFNKARPNFDPTSPSLNYTIIQETRAEAYVEAWSGKDVSEALAICNEIEAGILPAWYRKSSDSNRPEAVKPSIGLAGVAMLETALIPSEAKPKRGRPKKTEKQPWEIEGITRATWYRNQRRQKEGKL